MMLRRLSNAGPLRLLLLCLLTLAFLEINGFAASATSLTTAALRREFVKPPASARPWVYWFWMDGNISRSGITADLEAMQRVGIGGVILFDVSQSIPAGPVRLGSPEWHALFKHTITEADRLGLQVSVHNAPGYSSSGGPWIAPDQAMQRMVFSKTNLTGPGQVRTALPDLPQAATSHAIATLAFPATLGDGKPLMDFSPRLVASETATTISNLVDGNPNTFATINLPKPGKPAYLEVTFEKPYAASVLRLVGGKIKQSFQGALQASDEGGKFYQVREFNSLGSDVTLLFAPVTARSFRIVFAQADPALKQLTFGELELEPQYRIKLHQAKAGLGATPESEVAQRNFPTVPSAAVINLTNLVDLTAQTDSTGNLTWDIPPGHWTVLRFGYAPLGTLNQPATPGGVGLESDKLSRTATRTHFDGYLAALIADAGKAAGRVFTGVHIDSWEVGYQNWTPLFRTEFENRRGYDPLYYLPALTGRFVANPEVSERFLWDVRRTIADLLADNYGGHLAELVHAPGLQLSVQGYTSAGGGPFDDLVYGGRGDMPMAEFWLNLNSPALLDLHPMASAAHTYGKRRVAAEAFTSIPSYSAWREHPFALKPLGDAAFCEGINHFAIHRYAHQPWLDRQPGLTMGPWGLHYERTQTWWEQSRAWHEYLARCQFLLQQGLFVGDLCYLQAEGSYATPRPRAAMNPAVPPGYDYDLATAEVVLERMQVQEGRLALPDGMSYTALVLPDTERMTPRLLRKLKELVAAGATVVGPRPIKSPSLTDYPKCDRDVTELAAELWGQCDGKTVTQNPYGKGVIIWGQLLPEVLKKSGRGPDFQPLTAMQGAPLRWIHRQVDAVDIYFVANSNPQAVQAECQFRVTGKTPELWFPDDGHSEQPALWHTTHDTTTVPLKLDAGGSVFVVFSTNTTIAAPAISITRNGLPDRDAELTFTPAGHLQLLATKAGKYQVQATAAKIYPVEIPSLPEATTLSGPWEVSFPLSPASRTVRLDKLDSWTAQESSDLKYFSGTATYKKALVLPEKLFDPNQKLFLDLGRVAVIAELKLNGKDCGILWKPPFETDISAVARPGTNTLEIKVTNLWPNRMIGDEQLPADCQWRDPASADSALAEWPSWLLEGKPSPTGRKTFSTWKHWSRDSTLIESGLLGPVTVRIVAHHLLK